MSGRTLNQVVEAVLNQVKDVKFEYKSKSSVMYQVHDALDKALQQEVDIPGLYLSVDNQKISATDKGLLLFILRVKLNVIKKGNAWTMQEYSVKDMAVEYSAVGLGGRVTVAELKAKSDEVQKEKNQEYENLIEYYVKEVTKAIEEKNPLKVYSLFKRARYKKDDIFKKLIELGYAKEGDENAY